VPTRSSSGRRYKIKVHKKVTTDDSRQFDRQTRERIKRKIKELLSIAPEDVGEPLHFELSGYRKIVIFDAYRIIYRVDRHDVMVFVLAVGIRRASEVYRETIKRLPPAAPRHL
jgi:mRNA-degrading endonuclease RelE of RelBE toxin-antitoxin system